MENALFVRGLDAAAESFQKQEPPLERGSRIPEPDVESRAPHEIHGVEELLVSGRVGEDIGVEEPDEGGVPELGEVRDLAFETRAQGGGDHAGADGLEGDVASGAALVRAVDDAHAAGGKVLADLVLFPDYGSGGEGGFGYRLGDEEMRAEAGENERILRRAERLEARLFLAGGQFLKGVGERVDTLPFSGGGHFHADSAASRFPIFR